jgi:hypothetical protein
MPTPNNLLARPRDFLARAAFAAREHVLWRCVDALRAVADVVRWPFERLAWALERSIVWPLRERFGSHSAPLRYAALGLLAIAAGVLALKWTADGGSKSAVVEASAPIPAPVVREAPPAEAPAEAAPVLRGAKPDFTPSGGVSASKIGGGAAVAEAPSTTSADTSADSAPASSSATEIVPAGPAAAQVAHRFAGAFVRYETGQNDAKVRTAFAATATPQLARSLLHRPPRLPANAKVPRAKVLNLVPGPKNGDTYTMSVSLLRVGITSELRIDMQRDEKSGEWQVTDVLG